MRIEVTPTDALADEPLRIRLREFPPNCEVTIRAMTVDHLRCRWESWASFRSGEAGNEIDLSVLKPVRGTYEQADASGLIWSMLPEKSVGEPSPFYSGGSEALVVQFIAELGGNVVVNGNFALQAPFSESHPLFVSLWIECRVYPNLLSHLLGRHDKSFSEEGH
jgi:hypothetical protein